MPVEPLPLISDDYRYSDITIKIEESPETKERTFKFYAGEIHIADVFGSVSADRLLNGLRSLNVIQQMEDQELHDFQVKFEPANVLAQEPFGGAMPRG